ncbi:MAG: peptidase S45 [Chloroflexi bacterium RBG_19FT_COMBO_55_16]|nr:MAG: peptidase S45 [Chloroflexi bacterium RBG_19FT_COMBO_55_16]
MFRRVLIALLTILLVLCIVAAISAPLTVRRSFPMITGEIQLTGLDGPVDIFRDKFGIPHIYATNPEDLFFTQGYVHAQDRFWQMDFWRHLGSGRLSEMFGESQLETDKFLRTLGWARVAQQELAVLDPTSQAILEAYAEGVNAYLADHLGSALSLEYAVLKLINADYQPEPWQPLNSLTWAKVMAWDLGGNMDDEIERATLLKTLTPAQVHEIIPSYPTDMPVIVPGFQVSAQDGASKASAQDYLDLLGLLSPAWEAVKNQVSGLETVAGPTSTGIGSNSWVISGQLTNSGTPILANDPHLGAQMPSIWYEVGLHCAPKGETCPYEVTGVSFAGAPGVIIGHNDHIAWGMTNVGPDVQDLYIEKINPANPDQYEVNGQWVDMQVVKETIQIGGGDPVELTVRYTRHGPIISETYLPEDFTETVGIELPSSYAIALRWTALETGNAFPAIWMFNRAKSWEDFRVAAAELAAPSQNLVYADVDGNIGYQTPGKIPIRASGDGSLPVPGWTDEFEWTGYIPFDEMPNTFNPPGGYVVTANNAVVEPSYPYLIALVWAYGYRAQHIVDMIESAPGPIDLAYVQKMQGDNKDLNAENLVPVLMGIPLGNAHLEASRQLLQGWDYQSQMDSAPAALFAVFWKNLLAATFHDDLPEDTWPKGGDRWFVAIKQLLDQPDSPWWDNHATSTIETRDAIISQAFAAAVEELESALGKDPAKWTWGDLHTLTLENQTLGQSGIAPIEALFNRGPFRTSGGDDIVNATGWDAATSYVVETLPSMRMIVDLGDLNNSLLIHTTGQSGHAYHPHYVDMTDLWRTIQYHPMLWERSQVEDQAEGHLHLAP